MPRRLDPLAETPFLKLEERRVWVRLPCDMEASCQPLAGENRAHSAVKITDLSRGGALLVLNRHFPVKSLLHIYVQPRGEFSPRTLLARVVHVAPVKGGKWGLGCTFGRELTDEEMRTFLEDSIMA